MEATLVIVQGKANKSRVVVQLPSVIGRGSDADLRVAHPMVSRHHCRLYEKNGLVKVRDLDSLNGVFVGDQKVREATLPPNAVFSIGPLSFRAEYEYFEDPPDPSEGFDVAEAASQEAFFSEPGHGTEQSDLTPPMPQTAAAQAGAGWPEATTIEEKRAGRPVPSGQTKPQAAGAVPDTHAECGPPTACDDLPEDGAEQTTDEVPQGPDLQSAPTASASREETSPVDHPAGSGPLPRTAPPDESQAGPDDPDPVAESLGEDEQLSKFLQGLD